MAITIIDLPAEIRDIILKDVIEAQCYDRLEAKLIQEDGFKRYCVLPPWSNLLQVTRQTYDDVKLCLPKCRFPPMIFPVIFNVMDGNALPEAKMEYQVESACFVKRTWCGRRTIAHLGFFRFQSNSHQRLIHVGEAFWNGEIDDRKKLIRFGRMLSVDLLKYDKQSRHYLRYEDLTSTRCRIDAQEVATTMGW